MKKNIVILAQLFTRKPSRHGSIYRPYKIKTGYQVIIEGYGLRNIYYNSINGIFYVKLDAGRRILEDDEVLDVFVRCGGASSDFNSWKEELH